jgi:hypothetical protein
MRAKLILIGITAFIVITVNSPLFAQSTPYFQGKTILLIQGREPGWHRRSTRPSCAAVLEKIFAW